MKLEHARKILEEDKPLIGPTNDTYEGMKVITEIYDGAYVDMAAEHDQIWYGDFEETVEKMEPVQVIFMASCGWFEAEGSWSTFI